MRVLGCGGRLVLCFFLFARVSVDAQLCKQWAPAVRIGSLPPLLNESSGIAASRAFPGRLYHINDSGDTGRFYISGMDGGSVHTVRIDGFRPDDTEALSLGPCPTRAPHSCLYVGDIGDNRARRQSIEIIVIDETQSFQNAVKPTKRLTLRYPDGPHDAESMAVHPDGTLFILSKEHPARLFKTGLHASQSTLEFVTTLDTGHPPTDMAISDDGSRLIVLTYEEAVEFDMDFKTHQRIPVFFLQQQESATYLPGSRSFVYATERAIAGLMQPIMKMECAVNP
jgi:hypothetical protein